MQTTRLANDCHSPGCSEMDAGREPVSTLP